MESISPNISNPRLQEDKEMKNNKGLKIVVVLLLLIIFLFSIFIYLLFTKSPLLPNNIPILNINCEGIKNETNTDTQKSENDITLVNEDWALYQYPEYGFSIEIPSNNSFYSGYEQSKYLYSWNIKNIGPDSFTDNQLEGLSFNNFEKIIKVSYEPDTYPDLGTEIDALNPTIISFSFFTIDEEKTIEEIEEKFEIRIKEEATEGGYDIRNYEVNFEKYLDWNSFSYSYNDLMYGKKGTVLLTDEYIIEIDKTLIFSDGKELEIVNEVLETLELIK